MPSTSPAQHNLMEAVAHNAGFAQKTGIPQSVGQDFAKADAQQSPLKAALAERVRKQTRSRPGAKY